MTNSIEPAQQRFERRVTASHKRVLERDSAEESRVPVPSQSISFSPSFIASISPLSTIPDSPRSSPTNPFEVFNFTRTMPEDRRSMPRPYGRDAPFFNRDKPEELRRFISQVEDCLTECKIDDEQEKKKWLGKYTDFGSEEEWRNFPTFETGSWENHKAEIIENYPEAADAERGSLARLESICKMHKLMEPTNLGDLLSLKRAFNNEAQRLTKDPPLVSNRELVNMFTKCLVPEFRQNVMNRVSVMKTGDNLKTRRPEDLYDYQEIINTAIEIARGSAGRATENAYTLGGSTSLPSISGPVKGEIEDIKHQIALLQDRLEISNKSQKAGIEEILKTLQQTAVAAAPVVNNNVYRPPYRPAQSLPPAQSNPRCWYCFDTEHQMVNCPERATHLAQGKIILNRDNKMRLPNNDMLPRQPESKCIRDKVDDWHQQNNAQAMMLDYEDYPSTTITPGIIPLGSHIDDKYSVYTNRIVDRRDEIIDQLNKRQTALEQLIGQKTQTYVAPAPPPINNNTTSSVDLVQQLGNILQNFGKGVGQDNSQYISTRTGNQSAGPSQGF